MPLGIDPEALLIVGVVAAGASLLTYTGAKVAERAGGQLEAEDFLPMPPPYPPLPRFMYQKPELLAELR